MSERRDSELHHQLARTVCAGEQRVHAGQVSESMQAYSATVIPPRIPSDIHQFLFSAQKVAIYWHSPRKTAAFAQFWRY